jgi:hypothetical protein
VAVSSESVKDTEADYSFNYLWNVSFHCLSTWGRLSLHDLLFYLGSQASSYLAYFEPQGAISLLRVDEVKPFKVKSGSFKPQVHSRTGWAHDW